MRSASSWLMSTISTYSISRGTSPVTLLVVDGDGFIPQLQQAGSSATRNNQLCCSKLRMDSRSRWLKARFLSMSMALRMNLWTCLS